jgi:hypothetical protein
MTKRIPRRLSVRLCLIALICFWLLMLTACSHLKSTQPSVSTQPWFASLREGVVMNVEDTDRAQRLLVLINRMETSVMKSSAELAAHQNQLQKLNMDYDAKREDIENAYAQIVADTKAVTRKLRGYAQEMKAEVSQEEWEKIFDNDHSLFEMYFK